jgi:hypothetical protein
MRRKVRIVLLICGFFTLLTGEHCFWHDEDCTPTEPGCGSDEKQERGARSLSIAPIAQQTPVWCWAASAEMVFRHYGLPSINPFDNYQCGIVAAYFQGACLYDCSLCVAPIATLTELQRVVNGYGVVARQSGRASPVLVSDAIFRALSMVEVVAEIDAGRPIIAGISAGGFPYPNVSQHAVVVVGYDASGTQPMLLVNDPFPYDYITGAQNPYYAVGAQQLQPGRYRISYQAMVGLMVWANTIYRIRDSGSLFKIAPLGPFPIGGDHSAPALIQ